MFVIIMKMMKRVVIKESLGGEVEIWGFKRINRIPWIYFRFYKQQYNTISSAPPVTLVWDHLQKYWNCSKLYRKYTMLNNYAKNRKSFILFFYVPTLWNMYSFRELEAQYGPFWGSTFKLYVSNTSWRTNKNESLDYLLARCTHIFQ